MIRPGELHALALLLCFILCETNRRQFKEILLLIVRFQPLLEQTKLAKKITLVIEAERQRKKARKRLEEEVYTYEVRQK